MKKSYYDLLTKTVSYITMIFIEMIHLYTKEADPMAQRLTTEEVALIRRLYAQCGVYADVARIVGRSPSTVAKCVKEKDGEAPLADFLTEGKGRTADKEQA